MQCFCSISIHWMTAYKYEFMKGDIPIMHASIARKPTELAPTFAAFVLSIVKPSRRSVVPEYANANRPSFAQKWTGKLLPTK